jgi:hypothetical protein
VDITNRLKSALAAFKKVNNGGPDPNAFLKYGHRRMPSTWSTPEITDEDFYTGYGFAVVNKRANRSVVLGKNFLFTNAKEDIIKKANEEGTRIVHPYLELIHESVDFAERDFWYDISTYLDLEGIYYLMAVRTVTASGLVGNIQKFSLLNPYNIRPVINSKGELGGYVERSGDSQRQIPKEMMIVIRLLNPFDNTKAYSLADAARDSQFTMKQANDFAREAIDGNLNAPGIISSAIELPDDQFDNFVERVKHHGRGEPLFGNGSGTVTWVDMQADLDKAALDKINSISRDALLAVSGLSKTGVGVEESGTGREVSRTQKDDFTENAVMPQIENIIDALNLDYRRFYSVDYKKFKYSIALDNPLETDRDAEQKDVEIRDSQFALLQSLTAAGYTYDIAAKYAKGLLEITDLGEAPEQEEKEPVIDESDIIDPEVDPSTNPSVDPKNYSDKQFNSYEGYPIPVVQYLEELGDQINPMTEVLSIINSTKVDLTTVRISYIDALGDYIMGIVDKNTYIKLGEFHKNADRVAILAKLNKRYKNQPVAVKKKIDLTACTCNHDLYETIKNSVFDKQEQIDSSTSALQASAVAVENKIYQWYVDQLSAGVPSPHPTSTEEFINSMTLPFAVWFTVMFPIFASHRVQETAKNLDIKDQLPIVAMTEEVKTLISNFARKEATSHVNTMITDVENALAIIRAKTSNPQEIKALFEQAFVDIQNRRAIAIANNAAARIFNISQYEADLQFLTRAGLVDKAYKVLFSLTGTPCSICQTIIAETNASPIPFTANFASMGDSIEADGNSMTFNFENIIAGNVHPNCCCAYRLIIDKDVK